MLSDAEMELRRTGIGASEAAAAIGLSPYKTPIDLWLEKTSTEPPNRDWYKPGKPAYFGTLIEDVIADTYAAIHDVKLRRTHTLAHPTYDFILATPDREIVGQKKLLECKASSPWRSDWGEEYTDEIPTEYVVQCHQQMAVRGWVDNGCDIAVFKSITDYREYHVPFDYEFWDIIVSKLRQNQVSSCLRTRATSTTCASLWSCAKPTRVWRTKRKNWRMNYASSSPSMAN